MSCRWPPDSCPPPSPPRAGTQGVGGDPREAPDQCAWLVFRHRSRPDAGGCREHVLLSEPRGDRTGHRHAPRQPTQRPSAPRRGAVCCHVRATVASMAATRHCASSPFTTPFEGATHSHPFRFCNAHALSRERGPGVAPRRSLHPPRHPRERARDSPPTRRGADAHRRRHHPRVARHG